MRDRIHQGWSLIGLWLIDTGITAAAVQRTGLHTTASGVAMLVESDAVDAKTSWLAALLRHDPQLCRLALDADLDGVSALSPGTAAALTTAVDQIGHRGSGEIELANLMFADDPATLLVAAARPRPQCRGEIFYLTCDEAVTLPADARLRIKRRRVERERLQSDPTSLG